MNDTACPFPVIAQDEILVGHVRIGPHKDQPFLLKLDDLARHLAAFGSTGSGKTVLLKVLAESALAKGIPVLALDVQGDLTGLLVPAGSPADYCDLGLPAPVGLQDEHWQMAAMVAERMREVVHPRFLTPYENHGERLAISPLPLCPKDLAHLDAEEPDELVLMASSAAYAVMGRCGLQLPKEGVGGHAELVRGAITATILQCWRGGVNLDGVDGITRFSEALRTQRSPAVPEKDLDRMLVGLQSLSIEPAARWLMGKRLDWDDLLSAPPGKTPLVVVGLNHLAPENIPWVVAQVLNSAYDWCSRGAPNPGRPRLLTVVDELAGEGGRQALLPPLTYSSSSGLAIRRILRKGRHQGMCLAAGTQAPRDIDTKNSPNFNTRFIGKVQDRHDARCALSGANLSGDRLKQVIDLVATTSTACMTGVRANGHYDFLRVRWLGTLHNRLSKEQIGRLYERGLLRRSEAVDREILAHGRQCLETSAKKAVAILVPWWDRGILTALALAVPSTSHSQQWVWTGSPSTIWDGLLAQMAALAMDRGLRLVLPDPEQTLTMLAQSAQAAERPWPARGLGCFHLPEDVAVPTTPSVPTVAAMAKAIMDIATSTGLVRHRPPRAASAPPSRAATAA